jgi:NAD(P)H-hydrate epimerase
MKIVTAKQMRELDRTAIEDVGIPGAVLMENAGLQVVRVMREQIPGLADKKVLIVCGKGNNGGDGFVVARHLFNSGIEVRVALMTEKHQLKGDAKLNFTIAEKMNIPIVEMTANEQIPAFRNLLLQADVVVDSVLGTGLYEAVQGFYKNIIETINKAHKLIVAVDIPSGLSADTGVVPGSCIRADLTVTFAVPKQGLVLFPAANYVGELHVVDIGIPKSLIREAQFEVHLLGCDDVRGSFLQRRPNTHKDTYGHVLAIAGSPGTSGSAYLAGRSALRTGAGLVTLAFPESLYSHLEMSTIEVRTAPLPETSKCTLSVKAYEQIMSLAADKRVVVIGPGLTTNPSTVELVHRLITSLPIPMVIDADGLDAVAQSPDILLKAQAPIVLTPHPGEMARLVPNTLIQNNRIAVTQEMAQKYHCVIALKGARTIIASQDGCVFINATGNPGMATAGTGYVLAGIIAGLIAQSVIPIEATKAGVFLNGLAGDLVAEEKGDYGLIASDIIEMIPQAMKRVQTHHPCTL